MASRAFETEISDLESFYDPRSIAIIGASGHPRKPGGRPLAALQKRGYAGKVFPINPGYDEMAGVKCYPTILDVPGDVDMVIVSVPANAVPDVLRPVRRRRASRRRSSSPLDSRRSALEGEALQQKITELREGERTSASSGPIVSES